MVRPQSNAEGRSIALCVSKRPSRLSAEMWEEGAEGGGTGGEGDPEIGGWGKSVRGERGDLWAFLCKGGRGGRWENGENRGVAEPGLDHGPFFREAKTHSCET